MPVLSLDICSYIIFVFSPLFPLLVFPPFDSLFFLSPLLYTPLLFSSLFRSSSLRVVGLEPTLLSHLFLRQTWLPFQHTLFPLLSFALILLGYIHFHALHSLLALVIPLILMLILLMALVHTSLVVLHLVVLLSCMLILPRNLPDYI